MDIGFTGSRHGITEAQAATLVSLIVHLAPAIARHGDCTGGDEKFHALIRQYYAGTKIIGHPPIADHLRAHCDFDEVEEPLPYLERDRAIVDKSEILLACPDGYKEKLRSGTWATIRYARKLLKNLIIIYPDGSIGSYFA